MSNSTTTNAGVILTIPANTSWHGCVTLSATLAVTVGGSAATQFPSVTVSGVGGTWADGDVVLRLALFVPAVGLTALTGSLASASLSTGQVHVQARENPLNLVLNIGSGVTGVATAVGEFL